MPDRRRPTVSVLLPCYNAERYISSAMESLISQRFSDFEVLAHDDGSSDSTFRILMSFAQQDNRIKVTRSINRGLITTLNELTESSRGQYLARMDADDLCHPERFQLQMAFLEKNCDHVLVGSWARVIDQEDREIMILKTALNHEEIDFNNIRGVTSILHPSVMMKKEVVVRLGGYNCKYDSAEDGELWLRLAEVGKLANLPKPLIMYRVHEESISSRKRKLQEQNCKAAVQEACERRGIEMPIFEFQAPRGEPGRKGRAALYRKYGWQAWHSGNRDTCRHYGWKSVREAPLLLESWKLVYCSYFRSRI